MKEYQTVLEDYRKWRRMRMSGPRVKKVVEAMAILLKVIKNQERIIKDYENRTGGNRLTAVF